jgi:hypothetical protein
MFDEEDISCLAGNLSREQLLLEIHNAEVQEGVSKTWAEDNDAFYWREFGKACRAALDIQKSREPQRAVRPGQVSIAATKERTDIVEVVSHYTDLRNSGKEYTGCCPFHDDKHPSLRVNQEKQVFYCFSCGRKGDLLDFVTEAERITVKEACLLLDARS